MEVHQSTSERIAWFCLLLVFIASAFVGTYVLGVMAWEFTRSMLGYVVCA